MQVAVFQPGTQHCWQTALALQDLGRLAWFATSIFYQPDRFPYVVGDRLPGSLGERARREFSRVRFDALDPRLVRTAGWHEWVQRIAERMGARRLARTLDMVGNRRFAELLDADIRSSVPFALWGFNNSSLESFELGREYGRHCVLDRTIGDHRSYNKVMDAIADRDRAYFLPDTRRVPDSVIERGEAEYRAADLILVGSEFPASTIRESTGDPSIDAKLRIVPYCFDEGLFGHQPPPRPISRDEPVKFLFLGQLNVRKGIQHALEAIERISPSAATLTLVGQLGIPQETFARFAGRVEWHPTVPRPEVPRVMAEHHVLLMPSYFEGSALTLLEALASGMALIQTRESGNGVSPETGILLDAPGSDILYEAMQSCIDDRDRLDAWRAAAQDRSKEFTFARYRSNVERVVNELEALDR